MKTTARKLCLNLDELSVESFDTLDAPFARPGTVRAYLCSDVCTASCDPTCGILPPSAESECNALPESRHCGGTQDLSICGPCCV
jgi:hypothetical protein